MCLGILWFGLSPPTNGALVSASSCCAPWNRSTGLGLLGVLYKSWLEPSSHDLSLQVMTWAYKSSLEPSSHDLSLQVITWAFKSSLEPTSRGKSAQVRTVQIFRVMVMVLSGVCMCVQGYFHRPPSLLNTSYFRKKLPIYKNGRNGIIVAEWNFEPTIL